MKDETQLDKRTRAFLLKSAANAAENVEKRLKDDGVIISGAYQRLLDRLKKPTKP